VTMRNIGTAAWPPDLGGGRQFRLGSQSPQDNSTWGLARVGVPHEVEAGSEVTFNFSITAPPSAGSYNFSWRMVQDEVEWFGSYSQTVVLSVGQCASIRDNIASARQQIGLLTSELETLDPRFPGDRLRIRKIHDLIAGLNATIDDLQRQALALGCGTV
jgi:hypothetical protein